MFLTGVIGGAIASIIYRNDGDFTFTDINAGITDVSDGSSSWGDYDNDGDLDFLLTGYGTTKIYRNDGNDVFTDINAGLANSYRSSASWGDYDNDGDLDILFIGEFSSASHSIIYRNDGNDVFTDINAGLTGIHDGFATWGDYDNDGDLDILLSGEAWGANKFTIIYRNDGGIFNTAPTAPTGLFAYQNGNTVTLSWNKATDAETAQNSLTYNIRIGTQPNGIDNTTPMADITNGYRLIPAMGNGQLDTTYVINDLPLGTYYWSVQAIDNAFAGSGFATEGSFIVLPIVAIQSVSPDSLDFGGVSVGNTATEQVTVKNTGTADLNVSSIAISGVDAGNFSVDTTPFTLAPGDSTVLDVSFTPDDTVGFSASLDIDSDGGSASVDLAGDGFEPGSDYGLVAYYPFDGNANDESGNGNDGLIMGGVTFETSTHGQAARFSSRDTYILLEQPGLNANGWSGITISAWINMSGYTTYGTVIQRGDATPNYSYSLKVGGTYSSCQYYCPGRFAVVATDTGFSVIPSTFSDTLPLPGLNTWYHIVGVYDGINIRYYVNGTLDGEEIIPEGFQGADLLDNGNFETRIGGSPTQPTWSDQHLNGLIDEVRFYDRALSDSEIQMLYEGTVPELSISPLSIDFDNVSVGETATEQVTVKNTGTADLNVSSIAISGVDAGNFSVDTTNFTLAPGDSLFLDVNFTPDDTGSFSASLDIESDGGSANVVLSGNDIIDPAPSIVSISDVPDDQGGWVYLSWLSSPYDTSGEITQYGIWELNPDDEWVALGNVPAIQEDDYIYLAHTFGDSTDEGIFWSTFMITAHTTDPEMFYTSAVDSGYSVDNLAPAVPIGLLASATAENTVELSWDSPVDEDFDYFKIYRSLTPDFDPTGLEPFAETIDTTFTDSDVEIGETYYYILSAIDFNGNESDFSDEVSAEVLSLDEFAGIPDVFALRQNYPNPFNPVTTLRYDLPEQSFVTLVVYDLLGREVKRLVSGRVVSGYHAVVWDGTNNTGESVCAGVYLYRISSDKFTKVNKMILLR